MKNLFQFLIVAAILVLSSCSDQQPTITVSNSSPVDRENEVVTVDIAHFNVPSKSVMLIDSQTGQEIRCQVVDANSDNMADAIKFQLSLKQGESKQYVLKEGVSELKATEVKTFARFVPERTDDFTWENDRVAFRTYGPEAQRMIEESIPGGTLSSGIDCWLKKVDYSIIDKWYQGNIDEPGYYHIDHGEGLDNYHVGPSRGCGGTGVMVDGKLYTSKNFTTNKVIENGPLTSLFELDYEPYKAADQTVKVRKYVSIDLGTNFTKYVIEVEGSDELTTGITLHDNEGVISKGKDFNWVNYHTPHKGEQLSTSIVVHPDYYVGTSEVKTDVKDESHALMHLKVIDGKVEFYAGFAWSGSQQFADNAEWEKHLNYFAQTIKYPLTIQTN